MNEWMNEWMNCPISLTVGRMGKYKEFPDFDDFDVGYLK